MSTYYKKLLSFKKNLNDKVLILGLGVENKQFLEWLVRSEVSFLENQIVLADENEIQFANLNAENYEIISGKKYLDVLKREDIKMVIKAPGIWSLRSELKDFRARNGADSVLSSLTFFMEKYRDQIIGITGTKGKTTTSVLIYHLLKDEHEIYYCGNTTGISPYRYWGNPSAYFILELSSFQLQDLGVTKLSPKYAGVTNLNIDHLDQHKNTLEYHKSKENLWKYQKSGQGDICLYSSQVADVMSEIYYGLEKQTNLQTYNQVNQIVVEGIKSTFKINLLGDHNYLNFSLAIGLAETVNSAKNQSKKDLNSVLSKIYRKRNIYQEKMENFKSPQGRLELVIKVIVGTFNISFYNDNTATEPDAVIAGLQAVETSSSTTVLILAGKVKQGDYEKLAEVIKSKIKQGSVLDIKYFGQIGSKMRELINPKSQYNGNLKTFLTENYDYINEVLELLKAKQAKHELSDSIININILFSPAGSSFDEFENYLVRQECYLKWVAQNVEKNSNSTMSYD